LTNETNANSEIHILGVMDILRPSALGAPNRIEEDCASTAPPERDASEGDLA
jgi:hypothetical protein